MLICLLVLICIENILYGACVFPPLYIIIKYKFDPGLIIVGDGFFRTLILYTGRYLKFILVYLLEENDHNIERDT